MVQFRLDFPDELHHAFKVACAIEGVTMRDKLVKLVREFVEQQEKKVKK